MRFASSLLLSLAVASLVFAAAPGCSSSAPAAPTNGVDDVLKACEIRVPWANTSSTPCNNCIGLSTTPRCPCTDQDYAGKCSDQTSAKNKEPTCDGTFACVDKCARTDCACIDGCYASKPACRTLASAADGCVAEICDQYCK
jgi:hypothetical protein